MWQMTIGTTNYLRRSSDEIHHVLFSDHDLAPVLSSSLLLHHDAQLWIWHVDQVDLRHSSWDGRSYDIVGSLVMVTDDVGFLRCDDHIAVSDVLNNMSKAVEGLTETNATDEKNWSERQTIIRWHCRINT